MEAASDHRGREEARHLNSPTLGRIRGGLLEKFPTRLRSERLVGVTQVEKRKGESRQRGGRAGRQAGQERTAGRQRTARHAVGPKGTVCAAGMATREMRLAGRAGLRPGGALDANLRT